MSLFSSFILPIIEKEIKGLAPDAAKFVITQFKFIGKEVVEWAETKLNTDLNGDGTIGEAQNEAS